MSRLIQECREYPKVPTKAINISKEKNGVKISAATIPSSSTVLSTITNDIKHLQMLKNIISGNTSWRSGQDLGKLYDNVTPNPTG